MRACAPVVSVREDNLRPGSPAGESETGRETAGVRSGTPGFTAGRRGHDQIWIQCLNQNWNWNWFQCLFCRWFPNRQVLLTWSTPPRATHAWMFTWRSRADWLPQSTHTGLWEALCKLVLFYTLTFSKKYKSVFIHFLFKSIADKSLISKEFSADIFRFNERSSHLFRRYLLTLHLKSEIPTWRVEGLTPTLTWKSNMAAVQIQCAASYGTNLFIYTYSELH